MALMSKTNGSYPIGRERPFPKWLLIFCGYIVASASTIATVIGLFEGNENLGGARSLVWALECITIILTAAIVTLGHVAVYYRRRYKVHRRRGLIHELYPNRVWLQGNYEEFLRGAESEFIACGISLHTLVTTSNLQSLLHSALQSHQDLHIYFVFQEPYSAVVKQRESEEDRPRDRISSDCHSNINAVLSIKSKLGELGSRFHVHTSDQFAPVGFFLVSDHRLFLEPYLHKEIGRNCPTIRMERNKNNKAVWDKLRNHLRALIRATNELESEGVSFPHLTPLTGRIDRAHLRRAIFLDRDGVLIEDKNYLSTPDDIRLLPGVDDALRTLFHRYRLIVITNQSGVARGYFTEKELIRIHSRLLETLEERSALVDAIYYCPHLPEGGVPDYRRICSCRKPSPGLLLAAIERFNLQPEISYMVGDKVSDVEAGRAAGTKTVLITGTESARGYAKADLESSSLSEAVDLIMSRA